MTKHAKTPDGRPYIGTSPFYRAYLAAKAKNAAHDTGYTDHRNTETTNETTTHHDANRNQVRRR